MPEFRLPFPPVGTNHTKAFRQRNYIATVRGILCGPHRPAECDVILRAVFSPPAGGTFVRYDLDNLLKPTLDALKGIAYIDDNQVRCLCARFGHRAGQGSVFVRIDPIVRKKMYQPSTSIFQEGEEKHDETL
ncbi:MAG: RusA family crossover junction endodeoxyribonuclease [Lentisphaeria bacterium]|nr:RusA family crossover junction endodeoxyribonuclease [Lentisphaeria bacterium]